MSKAEDFTLGYSRFLFTAAIVAVALAGCSNKSSSSSSGANVTGPSNATKTIGVSIQNREAQFYKDMEDGMTAAANRYGYKLIVVDANRDNQRQQSQVEDFISKKVDAIVLTPYDSQAIGSAIVEANNANIPVFTADIASTAKQGTVVAHIASDNVQGGEQAGKLMCQALPGKVGTVAIIDEPEVTSVQDRVKGFRMALQQNCRNVTVVADLDAGGDRQKANSTVGDVLQSHKNLKGIFGINDDSALGAVAAIKAANASGVVVIGYDATPEAQSAIKSGDMYGDAIQYPAQIGAKTIQAIHDYFAGHKPPARVTVTVGTFTKANAK
ncbi:MAG: substrate-binding domain-containing protein [Candidatus Eremiobacteraeota bacterium]|nr:substrate-binding domain-containing protein [Candidatus Eremiobacteraeota bacterium]MBV9971985.1 substrate-binding domain-containing protein [Candidatus Eremiobacteraeota bacterium]